MVEYIADSEDTAVCYEHTTMRVRRDREQLYRDAYGAFGWTVERCERPTGAARDVVLTLRRDLRIPDRATTTGLQGRTEAALRRIEDLERAATRPATIVGCLLAAAGCGALVGAAAAHRAGRHDVARRLAAAGGVLAAVLVPATTTVRRRGLLAAAPLIDREHSIVVESADHATMLVS